MTLWQPTRGDRVSLIVVVLLPLVAALPVLTGYLQGDPMLYVGGLGEELRRGVIRGWPYIDPNMGFQTQALGHFAATEWLHGRVPWWNPYTGVGLPLAAEYQPAVFFPLTLLLASQNGFAWHHVLLQVIAGLGTYGLLRQLFLGRAAATAGALVYAFNGTLAWFAHAPASPVAFLPWILWAIERASLRAEFHEPGGWRMLCASMALLLLAGFPETAYIGGLLALAWAVLRGVQLPAHARLGYAARIAIGGVLGICIAAPQVVSFFQVLPDSYVGSHLDPAAARAAFGSEVIVPSLIAPYAYGTIFAHTGGKMPLWMIWAGIGGYVTLPLLVLAVYGLAVRRSALNIVLAGWCAIALLRTFGFGPAITLLNWIPGVPESAFYRYAPPSWELALVILACTGLHELRHNGLADRRIVAACVVVALAAAGITAYSVDRLWPLLADNRALRNAWWTSCAWLVLTTAAVLGALWLARTARAAAFVAGVLVVDAALMFIVPVLGNPRAGRVDEAAVRFLQQNIGLQRFFTFEPFQPNYGAYFGIASINYNYLPNSKRWVDWLRRNADESADGVVMDGRAPHPPEQLPRRFAAYQELGVRFVISPAGTNPFAGLTPSPLRGGGIAPVYSDKLMEIFELAAPKPYFEAGAACEVRADTRLAAVIDCREPAQLLRRELFATGWSASVNGADVPIAAHGDLFQRIDVPAGRSEVRYRYLPPYAAASAFVAFAALAVLGAGSIRRRHAAPVERATPGEVDFVCNVCGIENLGVPLAHVQNREGVSCRRCGSSLRMRSLMRLLSRELYGRTMPVPEFPADKSITGLGMSDWEGYAKALAEKFSYTNTYYHVEPKLDITRIDESMAGRYRFVISSDVFEHIPPRGLDDAFRNARRLLQPGGFLLLTVPFLNEKETREHFPRLHDYRIDEVDGKRVLVNRTVDGEEERFEDLVFHGGDGMTLEMRMFAANDLKRRLKAAGFRRVELHGEDEAGFGVMWPIDFAIPIVARA